MSACSAMSACSGLSADQMDEVIAKMSVEVSYDAECKIARIGKFCIPCNKATYETIAKMDLKPHNMETSTFHALMLLERISKESPVHELIHSVAFKDGALFLYREMNASLHVPCKKIMFKALDEILFAMSSRRATYAEFLHVLYHWHSFVEVDLSNSYEFNRFLITYATSHVGFVMVALQDKLYLFGSVDKITEFKCSMQDAKIVFANGTYYFAVVDGAQTYRAENTIPEDLRKYVGVNAKRKTWQARAPGKQIDLADPNGILEALFVCEVISVTNGRLYFC